MLLDADGYINVRTSRKHTQTSGRTDKIGTAIETGRTERRHGTGVRKVETWLSMVSNMGFKAGVA